MVVPTRIPTKGGQGTCIKSLGNFPVCRRQIFYPFLPAGRQACPPLEENYGTKRFKNSFPTPDLRYFSLTLADFQSAKYSI